MNTLVHTLHVVLAGAWLGGVVFTTFVVSPALKAMKWGEAERVLVRSAIGKQYAKLREGHALVTEGVYRHVRHPMYASQWLWGVAQVLLLQNWVAGWADLALFTPLYVLRVPREERMMLDRFGEEYRAYMERTGRVVSRLS